MLYFFNFISFAFHSNYFWTMMLSTMFVLESAHQQSFTSLDIGRLVNKNNKLFNELLGVKLLRSIKMFQTGWSIITWLVINLLSIYKLIYQNQSGLFFWPTSTWRSCIKMKSLNIFNIFFEKSQLTCFFLLNTDNFVLQIRNIFDFNKRKITHTKGGELWRSEYEWISIYLRHERQF